MRSAVWPYTAYTSVPGEQVTRLTSIESLVSRTCVESFAAKEVSNVVQNNMANSMYLRIYLVLWIVACLY